MSQRPMTHHDADHPEVTATGLLAEGTARLAPLFAAAIWTCTWGFRIGAALLALGVALALVRGEPLGHEAEPFPEIAAEVLAGHAAGLIDLAIIWFMLTPVATVVAMIVSFWRIGDRRYAFLSLIVLAILGTSIALALNR